MDSTYASRTLISRSIVPGIPVRDILSPQSSPTCLPPQPFLFSSTFSSFIFGSHACHTNRPWVYKGCDGGEENIRSHKYCIFKIEHRGITQVGNNFVRFGSSISEHSKRATIAYHTSKLALIVRTLQHSNRTTKYCQKCCLGVSFCFPLPFWPF